MTLDLDINKKCYSQTEQHQLADQLKNCEVCKADVKTYKQFVKDYEREAVYNHSEMILLGLGALMVGAVIGHQIQ